MKKSREILQKPTKPAKRLTRRQLFQLVGLAGAVTAGAPILSACGGAAEKYPFSMDYYYLVHVAAEDLNPARELIDRADVLVLEGYGWDEEALQFVRDMSNGLISLKPFL